MHRRRLGDLLAEAAESVRSLSYRIADKFDLESLWLKKAPGGFIIDLIATAPENRGKGLAGKAMAELMAVADRDGLIVGLTPDPQYGSSKEKLTAWYASFGFVPNKGEDQVAGFKTEMIRHPGAKKSSVAESTVRGRLKPLTEGRPTCLDCVLKHLGQASALADEAKQGYPSHRWLAVGHMAEASAECLGKHPEFSDEIRTHRVAYMDDKNYDVPFEVLIKLAVALKGEG